jgi:hypothetical protein
MKLTRAEKRQRNREKQRLLDEYREEHRLAQREEIFRLIPLVLAPIGVIRVNDAFFIPSAHLYSKPKYVKHIRKHLRKMFNVPTEGGRFPTFIVQTRVHGGLKGIGIWRIV